MKTRILAISILLLAVIISPLAMGAEDPAPRGPRPGFTEGRPGGAGGPGSAMRMRDGMGGDRLMQQLDLTEEQKAKIKAIQEENQAQTQQAREAIRAANQSLREAIDEGTDDQIIAAGKALGEAYGKEGVLRAQTQRKINAVLTPEQQVKMKELRAQMQQRMQDRPAGNAPGENGPQGGRQGHQGQGPRGQGR